MSISTPASNLRREAPESPLTYVYVSTYKRGHSVGAGTYSLGGFNRTAYAKRDGSVYDPEKSYVASSWVYKQGTPENDGTVGKYFRTRKAAIAWILEVAAREGFVTDTAEVRK